MYQTATSMRALKTCLLCSALAIGLFSCTGKTQQAAVALTPQDAQAAFFSKLSALCGKSFEGVAVFPDDPAEPFRNARLLMYVQTCKDGELRIPFLVDEDKSRTWVLTVTPEGLLFKHDHRHADGTPDEVTNYGGLAAPGGSAFLQRFPADGFTAKLLPAAATNEWTMRLSEDGKQFSYILKRHGEMRFQADFDLTKAVGE
jgi:hypothetical protein